MKQYKEESEYITDLDRDRLNMVEKLRTIIHTTEPGIIENIKWNAPNYIWNQEDRITFSLRRPGEVKLILHMGAVRKEDNKGTPVLIDVEDLVEWNSDIRGTMTFHSVTEIEEKQDRIQQTLEQWLKIR